MMTVDFERIYRRQADPWGYRSRPYEQTKYRATLRACGAGPFPAALELGGSIGVFSALLAPRCETLTTIDAAPTAVRTARAALAGFSRARAMLGEIPGAIPDGPFDLVIASEVLYYLAEPILAGTLARLEQVLADEGRLVAVHWRPPGPERPVSAREVHDRLRALPWLELVADRSTSDYLLHAFTRRR